MYLSRFTIRRFRSCRSVEVQLQPALTLLVGENNAGKSNVIEALRLATLPLSGRRTVISSLMISLAMSRARSR